MAKSTRNLTISLLPSSLQAPAVGTITSQTQVRKFALSFKFISTDSPYLAQGSHFMLTAVEIMLGFGHDVGEGACARGLAWRRSLVVICSTSAVTRRPSSSSLCLNDHPTPGRSASGSFATAACASAARMRHMPSGLARFVASRAISIFGPMPALAVHMVASNTCILHKSCMNETVEYSIDGAVSGRGKQSVSDSHFMMSHLLPDCGSQRERVPQPTDVHEGLIAAEGLHHRRVL